MKTSKQGLVAQIFNLLSPEGQGYLRSASIFAVVAGLLRGLALLAFLPAATSLVKSEAVWGLGIGGWLLVLVVIAVLSAVAEYLLAIRNYSAALDAMVNIHAVVGDKVAQLPLGYFRTTTAGTLSRLVSKQMLNLGEAFAHFIAPLIVNSVTLIVLAIGCWIWSPTVGLLLTLGIPVMLLVIWVARKCRIRDESLTAPANSELAARLVEFTQHQPILRATGKASSYRPLREATKGAEQAGIRGLWWSLLGSIIAGSSTQLIAVVVVVLAVSSQWGFADPILTIVFVGIILRFTAVLADVANLGMALETTRPLLAQVSKLKNEPVLTEPTNPQEPTMRGLVSVRDVTFGYEPGKTVLSGVTHEFAPHSFTAIVGPSGCGKTTLARLIARFYEVDEGEIAVGGVPVKQQSLETLMKQISWVFQDVYLYDDTLRANIMVGCPSASEAEMRQAAELAGVMEIVNRLPDGWDTRVGEGGQALSGGERQRVSIARALLKNADIVLFDEATSALDPANEQHVVASLDHLRQRSTLIVIAHKLSTIKSADQIVVLNKQGQIAQVGSHEGLLAQGGTYREFWELREAAKGWSLT